MSLYVVIHARTSGHTTVRSAIVSLAIHFYQLPRLTDLFKQLSKLTHNQFLDNVKTVLD